MEIFHLNAPLILDEALQVFEYKEISTPLFPRGLSLERCEGDEGAELIEFTISRHLELGDIGGLQMGLHLISKPIPLYHSHVLWSFASCTSILPDGLFEFTLNSVGPHISSYEHDGLRYNTPKGLKQPELQAATFTFTDAMGNEKATFEYAFNGGGEWASIKRFTRDELAAFADGGIIHRTIRIMVARSYFTLSKLLKEPTTVSEQTVEVVERILRGEKPPGYDWAITVGSHGGDSNLPLTYYVHSAAFSGTSTNFKQAFESGRSVGDLIVMDDSQKNHCTIPSLAPDEMPLLISIAYGLDAPLPTNIERFGHLGRALVSLIGWDLMRAAVFPQWERAICQQALTFDPHSLSSWSAFPRLLMIVWTTPYGHLPAAKRVLIGIFADMVWLNSPPGEPFVDFVDGRDSVGIRALGDDTRFRHMEGIKDSMLKHLDFVCAVRKVGITMKKWNNQPPAPKREPADPTVVPIEDDGIEGSEEEEDEESAKWQCAIS